MRLVRQYSRPLAIAGGVHDALGADVEGATVIAFPEIAVVLLLELLQHWRVVRAADPAGLPAQSGLYLRLGAVVPEDLGRWHTAPGRNVPTDGV